LGKYQGFFYLAYFIADIPSFSLLKKYIIFPINRKKFLIESNKIKITNAKNFENKGSFNVMVLKCLKMLS
jgi:hypothetical protein